MDRGVLDYADMLEIPVSSCSITVKKSKKNKRKSEDDLKALVIEKVNGEYDETVSNEGAVTVAGEDVREHEYLPQQELDSLYTGVLERKEVKPKRKAIKADGEKSDRKFNIIFAQFLIVCALGTVLFLMNIFWLDANIGEVLSGLFGSDNNQTQTDNRSYEDFNVALPTSGDIALEEGVMTFSSKGGVYATADGVISSIVEEAGKYIIEIKHSNNFKTVIKGASMAFYTIGDSVYKAMPVAYANGDSDVTVSFFSGDKLIEGCTLEDDSLVWTKSV